MGLPGEGQVMHFNNDADGGAVTEKYMATFVPGSGTHQQSDTSLEFRLCPLRILQHTGFSENSCGRVYKVLALDRKTWVQLSWDTQLSDLLQKFCLACQILFL